MFSLPAGCKSTLPWVLFGVSCMLNVILAILLAALLIYFFRLRLTPVNQPAKTPEGTSPGPPTSSYLHTAISDQQPVAESNVDGVNYEAFEIETVKPTDRRKHNRYVAPRCLGAPGQVSCVLPSLWIPRSRLY